MSLRPLVTALLLAAPLGGAAPDPLSESPKNYRVVLENESVRVLEHFAPAGASEPRHHHPCRVVYSLAAYRLRIERGDGVTNQDDRTPRTAWWRPAEDHSVTNLGTTTAKELIVELKQPPAGATDCDEPLPIGEVVALTPSTMRWELDKEGGAARATLVGSVNRPGPFVQRLRLPKGYRGPRHAHDQALTATVVSGELRVGFADGRKPLVLPAGSYLTLPAGVVHDEASDGGAELELRGFGPFATTKR